jgi:hypothetical protein
MEESSRQTYLLNVWALSTFLLLDLGLHSPCGTQLGNGNVRQEGLRAQHTQTITSHEARWQPAGLSADTDCQAKGCAYTTCMA